MVVMEWPGRGDHARSKIRNRRPERDHQPAAGPSGSVGPELVPFPSSPRGTEVAMTLGGVAPGQRHICIMSNARCPNGCSSSALPAPPLTLPPHCKYQTEGYLTPSPHAQANIKKQKCGSPFHLANVSGPSRVLAGGRVLWLSELTVDGWLGHTLFIYVLVGGHWFLFRDHYGAGLARRLSNTVLPRQEGQLMTFTKTPGASSRLGPLTENCHPPAVPRPG